VTGNLILLSNHHMLFKKAQSKEDHYLELAVRGERAGLEYLVDTYQHMCYTLAVRILNNAEDAQEVVQDSFLKSFKHLGEFRRAAKFSSWLYQIVYHAALNRKAVRRPVTHPLDEQPESLMDSFAEPQSADYRLIEADRKHFVELALNKLAEEDRVIVSLYYLADKPVAEISGITGLGVSAVKMRLMRARKQLEQLLKTYLDKEIYEL